MVLISKTDPLEIIKQLSFERYVNAEAIFWAGSVQAGVMTKSSDLDLVIIFSGISHAYREAFIYKTWPIDAFIHDKDTLRYFFHKIEASDGRPALIKMILEGKIVSEKKHTAIEIQALAQKAYDDGPRALSSAEIIKERFVFSDIMDDINSPRNRSEQIVSAIHLFEPLIQFYFRAQKKWCASGKSLIRLLEKENPSLAQEFIESFDHVFSSGKTEKLNALVKKIIDPYGGYLWNGFRADAPEDWKLRK